MKRSRTSGARRRMLVSMALNLGALVPLVSAHSARAAPSAERPDWRNPAAVMHWAEGLDRKGWDYLGSTDDSIFFVGMVRRLPEGHRLIPLRVEFFDPIHVGPVGSNVGDLEADCARFKIRRLNTKAFAGHNLSGKVLNDDPKPTEWFDPPGNSIPAAVTGACLAAF